MSWKGMAFGGGLGAFLGGPLGAIIGAAIGSAVENHFSESVPQESTEASQSFLIYASLAAMLAKMAKADGHVTQDEIAHIERVFSEMKTPAAVRRYMIDVFRQAKDDKTHTIYDYARDFAICVASVEMREFVYEVLWSLAKADGTITQEELSILAHLPRALGVRAEWYGIFKNQYMEEERHDELQEAYAVLGASEDDSMETLKKKYRDLAKKNHPDALRAQGLPEELIGKATERMGRINDAWATICASRKS